LRNRESLAATEPGDGDGDRDGGEETAEREGARKGVGSKRMGENGGEQGEGGGTPRFPPERKVRCEGGRKEKKRKEERDR